MMACLREEEECEVPDFSSDLLLNLQQLYIDQKLCDFTIKVENREFKVHKVVISSASDYFRAMLDHDMIENQQDSVELKGLTVSGVEPILTLCYFGSLRLTHGNIYDVMNAANFLQILPAVNCCVQYLKKKLTFENAEDLLKISDLYSIPTLRSFYRKYVLNNFLEFALTDQFLSLDSETLADYLSDDSLQITSECMLLHLVMKWYNHDPESRKDSAEKAFGKIRFVVDGWPAVYYAIQCEPFNSIPALQDLMRFADKCLSDHHMRFIVDDLRTRVRYPKKTLIQIGGKIQPAGQDFLDFSYLPLDFSGDLCSLGWHKNHFYHRDLKKWIPLGASEISENRTSNATLTEVNGNAILCGGYVHQLDELGDDETMVTNETYMFTPSDCRLRSLPSMKHPRAIHAAVFLQGSLYAIGGCDSNQLLCSVEKLSNSGENDEISWSYVRSLPVSIKNHAAVACKNKIYVSGGIEDRDFRATDKVWCYCPESNKWKKKKSMFEKRRRHGMVNIKDVIYVVGGIDDESGILDTMETYDVETNTWTKLDTTLPRPTYKACAIAMDDKIWLVGGKITDYFESDGYEGFLTEYIMEYDPEKDTWSTAGKLMRTLETPACCALTMKLTPDGQTETDEIYTKYSNLISFFSDSDIDDGDALDFELKRFYDSLPKNS